MRTACMTALLLSHSLYPIDRAAHGKQLQLRSCLQPPAERSRSRRSARRSASAARPRARGRCGDRVPYSFRSSSQPPYDPTALDNPALPPDHPAPLPARLHPPEQTRADAIVPSPEQSSHLAPQLRSRVLRIQLLQFLPQLARFEVAGFRHGDLDFHNLISAVLFSRRGRNAFFAQPQLLPALRAWRNLQLRTPIDGRNFNLCAQGGLPCSHRYSHVDVVAFAAKHRVLTHANNNVEITCRSAARACVTFAGNADALSIARACLDPDFKRFRALHHAFPVADWAGGLDFACAAATRAGDVELHAAGGLG